MITVTILMTIMMINLIHSVQVGIRSILSALFSEWFHCLKRK